MGKEKEVEINAIVRELEAQEKAFREVRAQQDADLERIRGARQKDMEKNRRIQAEHDREIERFNQDLSEKGHKQQRQEGREGRQHSSKS